MKRPLCALALFLGLLARCPAEEITLPQNVIMRSDRSLSSIKAGSVVEVLSRDTTTLTIRYNGQTGTIPLSSLSAPAPTSAPAAAKAPSPRGARAIMIGSFRFSLAYAPPDSPVLLREYLSGEGGLDHWSRMASIRVFRDLNDPGAFLKAVSDNVTKSGPSARFRFYRNETTHELILDFMEFAPSTEPAPFAEWNLMRAKFVKGRGLVVYQYAVRYYTFGPQTGPAVDMERSTMMEPFENASFEEL